jgi:hypothetical protein
MMNWPKRQDPAGARASEAEKHACSMAAAVDFVMQMTVPALLCPRDGGVLITNGALNAITAGADSQPQLVGVSDCWACTESVYEALQRTMREDTGFTFGDQPFDVPQGGAFVK